VRPPPEVFFNRGGETDERNFWFAGPSFRCRRTLVGASVGWCAWGPSRDARPTDSEIALAPCHTDANAGTSNADTSDPDANASNINSHAETCDADADATAESQHDAGRHSDAYEYRKRNHH